MKSTKAQHRRSVSHSRSKKTHPRDSISIRRETSIMCVPQSKRSGPTSMVDNITDRVVDLAQGAAEQVGSLVKGTAHLISHAGSKVRATVTNRRMK